ncbi:hypothetical protein CYLTODRAFT_487196 [Cylindrobasidium torrendii FP15055 ss-10]|uniref:CCHC-type domain-containing protein n=1 Tax=Cylindrobasidium torrendii FP15055 ss-10 TaxID=1314674 RepID=A0A0D7BLJ8_9AGAR|nr:hypothetical protein CYLTODRAFT_487196 [Cylindrobasidium torrendii FP15055 ss-10]
MTKEIIDLTADSEEEIQEIKPLAVAPDDPSLKSKDKKKPGEEKRRKKRSKEKRAPKEMPGSEQTRPTSSGQDGATLFFVDEKPSVLPNLPPPPQTKPITPSQTKEDSSSKLLLPEHVKVFGSTPFEIIVPPELDEDFIDYLDYDPSIRKNVLRYYDDPKEIAAAQAKVKIVCKKCGGEGHSKFNCKVVICLTCGARNQHNQSHCPTQKSCFNCGMKGHLNIDCPSRQVRYGESVYDSCRRCSNNKHNETECPLLWRVYEYMSPEERASTLAMRKTKECMVLGQGGEGYIAADRWCWNCGQEGHWGDDCELPFQRDVPREGSAFHWRNVTSGPFGQMDAVEEHQAERRQNFRSWEYDEEQAQQSWEEHKRHLSGVGKAGKRKARERLAKSEHKQRDRNEDDGDFFEQRRRDKGQSQPELSIAGASRRAQEEQGKERKKMTFAFGSLAQRLGEGPSGSAERGPPPTPPGNRANNESGRRNVLNDVHHGANGGDRKSRDPKARRQADPYSHSRDRRPRDSEKRDRYPRAATDYRDRDRNRDRDRARDYPRRQQRYEGGYGAYQQ